MKALRILIADDNVDAADSLALLCRLWGHTPFVAYDGAIALELADRVLPQVILLDFFMPGAPGGEVARQLRADERFSRTLIYLTTSRPPEDSELQTHREWFDGYLQKPYNLSKLEALLYERAMCAS